MNVLLVDDQKAIVESLRNGINWERIHTEQVFTACSAREAKLILTNFEIDILISDIEMPEEDGLSLCRWAKEHFPYLECIFLTSHAEFAYAKEAIRMGGFDYILQPVRYTDVESAIAKAGAKVEGHHRIMNIVKNQRMVLEQRNTILDGMISNIIQERYEEADHIFDNYRIMFGSEYKECVILPLLIQIERWKKITNVWDEKLVQMAFCNVMEELFSKGKGKAGISSLKENRYWMILVMEQNIYEEEQIRANIELFYQFVNGNLDFFISIFPGKTRDRQFHLVYRNLCRRADKNKDRKPVICWEEAEAEADTGQEQDDPIEKAILYVKRNLSKNISRADVAREVHLNEEYFSRLFRQQTGATFRDYVLMQKMTEAQKLLRQSRLSVSIIASKVGYDNFSHFSKMFKKITNKTPQEYRKEFQK